VVIASSRRLAKIREFETEVDLSVHQMLAELSACDWALVEGFKHADLPKIEVWRASAGHAVQYPGDPFIVAGPPTAPALCLNPSVCRCSISTVCRPWPNSC